MSWNIKTPGDYINGPLTVAGAALFNSSIGIGEAAVNGIKLLSAVTTASLPQTSGVSQPGGAIRVTGQNTTGCLDIGTAGAVSWLQACRRTNLADNFALSLNPNGGTVGVATANPNNTLTVRGTQDAGIELNSADSNASRLIFAYDPANTRFYINSTLSGSGSTLPLAFLVGNTERARFNTTGAFVLAGGTQNGNGIGIAFPGTQSASTDANTLDDYEEGTFTPTVTSVGGTGIVYTPNASDSGRYTKIGRLVFFQVRLAGTYTGTFSYIRVAIPFASTNSNPDSAITGYNNDIGSAILGRTDYGSAFFIAINPQSSGQVAIFSGFITT